MADRGYWARLGLEGIEESDDDHPLGFAYGTLENGLIPRLAVLLQELTTPAQHEALNALWIELGHYCRQTNRVIEGLRRMARSLKDLEEDVIEGTRDFKMMRDLYREYPSQHRFDVETYKRSSVLNADLTSARLDVNWELQASIGRSLDERLAEEAALEKRKSEERYHAAMAERQSRVEASLLARLGVIYRTSPAGVDGSIPKNVREDIPAAERMLEAMGFEIQVDGHVRCCLKVWGDLVVYADPRHSNTLRFFVFRGPKRLAPFWIKDKTGNPRKKLEGQLNALQGRPLDEPR